MGWSFDGDEPPDSKAEREAANSGRQARRLMEMIREALAKPTPFELTIETLCELNRIAVEGTVAHPGELREVDLEISGSPHEPPAWQEVQGHVDQFIDTVNQGGRDAVELAAYVLWRVNWIHPFEDGTDEPRARSAT